MELVELAVEQYEMQDYFEDDGTPLTLCFKDIGVLVEGVTVNCTAIPVLVNERSGAISFPDVTRSILIDFAQTAKNESKKEVSIAPPKGFGSARYPFCEGFNFSYSSIDYTFIPGLYRPWNTGFLTPVFFNIGVLNKYSQNPEYKLDLFSSTYGTISKGDEWNIQFGVNKNKAVIMWLGDIDRLPDKEKYYLLSENIDSDHEIHSEFYDAQISVKWALPSIESTCFKLRNNISDIVHDIYGVPFSMLDGEVSSVIENLDKPIFWEDKHVSPVVEALNRIFVESINIKGLKPVIAKTSPEIKFDSKGSLKLVTEWLGSLKMGNHEQVMCPFYVLYDFRVMVCHLQSDSSKEDQRAKINKRLLLPEGNENYEIIYEAIFKMLRDSLSAIEEFFQTKRAGT